MEFSEKLSRLIGDESRARVARKAGLQPSILSNYINRGSRPMASAALKLARVFQVSVDWLVDDAQDWPPQKPTTQFEAYHLSNDELIDEIANRYVRWARTAQQLLAEAATIDWDESGNLILPTPPSDPLPDQPNQPIPLSQLMQRMWLASKLLLYAKVVQEFVQQLEAALAPDPSLRIDPARQLVQKIEAFLRENPAICEIAKYENHRSRMRGSFLQMPDSPAEQKHTPILATNAREQPTRDAHLKLRRATNSTMYRPNQPHTRKKSPPVD